MTENCCASYVRQVGRRLRCSKSEKKRLLTGLAAELADAYPESGSLSPAEISARFGAPKDMAAELQAALPTENKERYITHWERVKRIALVGLVLALCIGGGLGWLQWSKYGKYQNMFDAMKGADFVIVQYGPYEITEEEFHEICGAAEETQMAPERS